MPEEHLQFAPDQAMGHRALALVGMLILAASLLVGGCAASGDNLTIGTINDREASTNQRLAAIDRAWTFVEEGQIAQPAMREQLKRVAWSRNTGSRVRQAAMEKLLTDEPNLADTANMMRLMLPTETNWDVIGFISETAAERQWRELTPALVRSWSRFVVKPPDEQRPENLALQALYPDRTVADVVFDVCLGVVADDVEVRERDRMDAWGLLNRIDPTGAQRVVLLESVALEELDLDAEARMMLADLQRGARELKIVPKTPEELAWLQRFGAPEYATVWDESRRAVEQLSPDQLEGLALRHIACVRYADMHVPSWIAMSRLALLGEVDAELDDIKMHMRSKEVIEGMQAKEHVRNWEDRLVWADLLTILIARQAMQSPALAGELFQQADADQLDPSTEHGGVLAWNAEAGRFVALSYLPRANQRGNDRRFVASSDLLREATTQPFHYHFHAQSHHNTEYAGPSRGDREYAEKLGANCLVFTFLDRDRMGVDYYQPNGAQIDLGVIERPVSGK